jgi:hypothetical protein
MKTMANRMIVLAAGVIALGSVAFGQSSMKAEIPFAFHTASGTLPAGTYELRETQLGGNPHLVILRNLASQKSAFAGVPAYNAYRTARNGSVVEFVCVERSCALKAIRTGWSSLEYATPQKSKDGEKRMAVVSIALKPLNAD